ncbi:efflux RND transporter permease subunit [Acholeplasma manati]|uniref:Efflux RND transporter permease subunit n=1 Tax=Paracholeplasma manati TaxID=591373 RepID=A0ABT2Y4A9_9MOLU|nr:efflux RND transporter permease subunit [Paracholeplasma manati]MCV2231298.1 efflux RND transporter permease subunit [Paracholeplasma manati]
MSGYSVRKPITVIMGVLIVIVLGLFSITRLPLTLFPDIELPFVVTITEYQGASPEEVESEVSKKIESTVATISNFSEVSSMSNEHFAISIVTFADGANMDSVVIELRELLNNIQFVDGVGNTRILRISPDMLPVMTVTLFRDYEETLTDEEILIRNTEWIQRDLLIDLQSIPGVADVSISGQADVVLQINLDNNKLTTYGLDHAAVLQTIEDQNEGGLIGVALDSGELRMLYLGNKITQLDEIAALPIYFDGAEVIYLSDLIVDNGIKYINANTDTYSKINGTQGIQVSFTKQSNYGITEVSNAIADRLDDVMAREGEAAHYEILLDQGEYITQSIGSVLNNLIVGGVLAIVILFLFLRNIKPTIIVGLAIPTSVVGAFMLMYFTGVTLNLISMGGLALGIGMLVDNAVVVIENIYRMISEGKSKREAATQGAKEVAGAITSSTITTVAVFLPIVFIEGIIADVFISMALTIAYSLGASLIIALTLVPMMASRMLDDHKPQHDGKWMVWMKKAYENSVLFTLKHKITTLIVVLLLLVSSVWIVASKGFILLPESDEGVIDITVLTTSQTTFESKAAYTDLLTERLLENGDVETVSASIGGAGGFGGFAAMMGGSSDIELSINLKDNRAKSTKENEAIIKSLLAEFDYSSLTGFDANNIIETSISAQNSTGALGGASGISIKVSGYDLQTLEAIANDITAILEGTPGVVKPDNGVSQGADNVKITINKDNAMVYGLTAADVNANIAYLYQGLGGLGETQTLTLTIEGVTYDISLPNDAVSGGLTFDLFGDYLNFLSGIMLFSDENRAMIDRYTAQTGEGIYTIDPSALATGGYLKFIINPFLRVVGGEIVFNPDLMSADPMLLSRAVSPLYVDNANSVASIDYITGFTTINTDGSNRYVTVTAEIEDGKNVTLVSQEATRKVNDYLDSNDFTQYGNGYYVSFEGESEEILQAVNDLVLAALVAILLVYMVMAIQFQSLVYPFIILFTIPLAFTGGMLALLITNSYLSLVSIMGLVILVGIVVNNGIVLVDYINQLRNEGMTIKDAIVLAGKTRLRPIFMTSLTTILGLAALALGFGEGSELLQPMAITTIGGLIYSTILTLVVVPTIYALLNRKHMKKEALSNVADER